MVKIELITEARDAKGKVLATWRLWTNLEEEVKAEEIALWYYWRWRIESFFKLLKGGGQQIIGSEPNFKDVKELV